MNKAHSCKALCFAAVFCASWSAGFAQQGDWFNLDLENDKIRGVSVNKALTYLDSKIELKPVVVAVIDDGVDIDHPDFEGRIFVNEKEIPNDGVDNDGNSYVDDVHGWNFLGNAEGENIEFETLEITRLVRDGNKRYEGMDVSDLRGKEKKEYNNYLQLKEAYDTEVDDTKESFAEFSQFAAMYSGAASFAREKLGREDLTVNMLMDYEPVDEGERQVFDFLLMAERQGLREQLEEGSDYFDMALNHHYNFDFNPREMLNDSIPGYGNQMVWAANPEHGTHVAGIIAAVRGNDFGIDGIAPNAIVLPVRAVPGGDERDKDVAAAIRYAVEMGAKVINMSFGKSYSPEEELVQEAIRYAASKDVLMIHAAGNDASDNDRHRNYPDGTLGKRRSLNNWITVAASSPEDGSALLADFSNYGRRKVDILAPGVDILSLKPNGATASNSGTSMAAPVVSGVAAIIRGMYPELSAKEVRKILIRTAQPVGDTVITSEDGEVKLKRLVRNAGVVSAYEAVRYAHEKYDK